MAEIKVTCIIKSDLKKSFVEKSRYCSNSFIVRDFSEMMRVLLSMRCGYRVPVIAASDEAAAFLDENYDSLSAQYVLHDCRHKGGEIIFWMDKSRMLSLASKAGLTIPKTLSIKIQMGYQGKAFAIP